MLFYNFNKKINYFVLILISSSFFFIINKLLNNSEEGSYKIGTQTEKHKTKRIQRDNNIWPELDRNPSLTQKKYNLAHAPTTQNQTKRTLAKNPRQIARATPTHKIEKESKPEQRKNLKDAQRKGKNQANATQEHH